MAVARVEFADVVGKVLEFGLSKFVAAGCAEESGKCFLEDGVVRNVHRDFVALEGGFIHEREFFCSGKAEKSGQSLECFDIARRRVDAALEFAPIPRVQASLFAEVAQNRLCAQKRSAEAFI